jgi:hypothetical protein
MKMCLTGLLLGMNHGYITTNLGGKHFSDKEIETEVQKWLRQQQSKDFYAAGFNARVKRWDKSVSVGGGYVEK